MLLVSNRSLGQMQTVLDVPKGCLARAASSLSAIQSGEIYYLASEMQREGMSNWSLKQKREGVDCWLLYNISKIKNYSFWNPNLAERLWHLLMSKTHGVSWIERSVTLYLYFGYPRSFTLRLKIATHRVVPWKLRVVWRGVSPRRFSEWPCFCFLPCFSWIFLIPGVDW